MEYKFGPNKPRFTGTEEEWNILRQKLARCNQEGSIYPFVTVICPHCGATNTHISDGTCSHRECHLIRDKMGIAKHYDCPGYYINTRK